MSLLFRSQPTACLAVVCQQADGGGRYNPIKLFSRGAETALFTIWAK
ncbi:MAG: hypothetical protein WCT37_03885 [Patescibacteria group bacterium]